MSSIALEDPFYPSDDGEPMADNTLQVQWIFTIFGNLQLLFRDRPDVFVAANHLIYPVEGDNATRTAPDVYVALGRPKHHRGSYKVWEEDNLFPQVVFEVLSPGNRPGEMARKHQFYERFGAKEYYLYDPDRNRFEVSTRDDRGKLVREPNCTQFISPLLDIYFELGDTLAITNPDGSPFLTIEELGDQAKEARADADAARAAAAAARQEAARSQRRAATLRRRAEFSDRRAEQESVRADKESLRAEQEAARAEAQSLENERLRAALRRAGVDPDALPG